MSKRDLRLLIERKREGEELTAEQWHEVAEFSVHHETDPSQIAALFMACIFRGMTVAETVALTRAMIASGEVLAFTQFSGAVDKHSTGGVGDTASLILVPLLAACGEHVAKLSGRALGHTGGTLDKLESIAGFRTGLGAAEFESIIARVGCAIAAQSTKLVPADKVLYGIRDRTGTVPCMGLIASSIVSKKIAGGAERMAFDVKAGSGAFMKTLGQARELAQLLVDVAAGFGRQAVAVITDMHQPLSPAIGTGMEVMMARDFLRGITRPARLEGVVRAVGGALIGLRTSAAERLIDEALSGGAALARFEAMIEAQGGDLHAFHAMQPLPESPIIAPRAGYVTEIDTEGVGNLARHLVEVSGSSGGVRIDVSLGDRVSQGQTLGAIFGKSDAPFHLAKLITLGEEAVEPPPLVYASSISSMK